MAIFNDILARSISQDKLERLLALPRNYLGEEILTLIPSLNMTNEGPVLTRVYMVTKSFLCDVTIVDDDSSYFDQLDKSLVVNIRISTGQTTVDIGEEIKTIYKTATVRILHNMHMESTLEFVGEERDEWLAGVLEVFPASLVLQRR